jgi:hypothetical protein
LFAKDGLIDELKKALSERMLAAELDDHLESEAEAGVVNRRNGSSKKTMLTGSVKPTLDIPRDRSGTFDPKLIAKYQRRVPADGGPDLLEWTAPNTASMCQNEVVADSQAKETVRGTDYPHRNGHVKARLSIAWRRRD